jgi:3-hydroxyisobutyrate dehydrogenase-like beta-hydroxyacid dehydrogenase
MTKRVGVIGLGIMGSSYAKNLLLAGYEVCGSDPLIEAQDRLTKQGGTAHATTGDWLADCDLIILSLLSPVVMRTVADELATLLKAGQIVIETGTFALTDKEAARDTLSGASIILLDCPVSGTGAQAMNADILMMMSGPPNAIKTARPFVEHLTKGIIVAGAFGAGTQFKFVANHAVALHNTAAAETLAYADALGLDRDMIYDMLSTGAGQSRMSDLRMPLMISGAYDPPTATLKMFEKDLNVIGDDIARLDLHAPMFDACVELYAQASQTLPETYDTASVFEVYSSKRTQ